MKFETVRLYFLCEFSVYCHANFATMAMWHNDFSSLRMVAQINELREEVR